MVHDITVLLPVYNGEQFIAEAVNSILKQTYTNFELLIMDDGSTDQTPKILKELARYDSRIRLHRSKNRGLIATLNKGLTLSFTELIARMDADDCALPERLALQKAYMDAHPQIAVCGTGIKMYESGRVVIPRYGAPFDVLCLFGSPMAHPTVMYRRSVILKMGGYAEHMLAAEDYDLWCRLASAGYGIDNLPQPLLRYREHPQLTRIQYRRQSSRTTHAIWERQLNALGFSPLYPNLDAHAYCASPCEDILLRQQAARKWLKKLCQANRLRAVYAQGQLERECSRIVASFPPPLRLFTAPAIWVKRFLRYCCFFVLRCMGTLGERIESAIRRALLYFSSIDRE